MTERGGYPPELTVPDEWASDYFARRLPSDAWERASEADRRRALDWAASLLAAAFVWDAEAHPGGVWRGEVLALVCEEAVWLLERGESAVPPQFRGVRRASAGPVSVTFESGPETPAAGLISPVAADLAAAWSRPASGGGRISSTLLG